MVFFTCNICGESVKKPAVEKHYQQRCRGNNKNVSCMDCLKDFYGEEYVAHIKCISEAEKYASVSQGFVAKGPKNKNAKKQESWMDIIHAILDSQEYDMSPPVRDAFKRLQSVDNVPRKKAKFENYVANCMRMPRHQATQVWDILEKELDKMKRAKEEEIAAAKKQNKTQNGHTEETKTEVADEHEPAKKKAKKENGVAVESTPAAVDEAPAQFDWQAQLTKLIGKQDDGIFVEKLKKKLLKKYQKHLAIDELNEKQMNKFTKKFDKHLKRCEGLQIDGDLVKQRHIKT
ncbi:uncharacterized protein C16C10.8 [Scaptodrosophila lebanonensis]|uniref:Uncharacterized protein C16C10.8 n=1 Tax=Drosophila lebanonensis TaxID=7225 RepID=A0A6J2UG08_DROLE|nr:uncharacterized protein C16C10.8 [Scaptodrosophila lebanonensis]